MSDEAKARARAAAKIGGTDKTGATLPDELWMQCLPPSTLVGMILRLRAAVAADDTLTLLRAREADLAQANETVARLRAALRIVAGIKARTNADENVKRLWAVADVARAALEADNG